MGQRSWHAVPRHWKRRVRKHCCQWLIFVLVIRPYAKTFCFVRPNTIIFGIWFQTQENCEQTGENLKYFSLPEREQAFILANAEYFCLHSIAHRWVAKFSPKKQTCSEEIWSHKEQQDQQIQNFIFLIPFLLILPQVNPALICASNFFVYLLFNQGIISMRILMFKTLEKEEINQK